MGGGGGNVTTPYLKVKRRSYSVPVDSSCNCFTGLLINFKLREVQFGVFQNRLIDTNDFYCQLMHLMFSIYSLACLNFAWGSTFLCCTLLCRGGRDACCLGIDNFYITS